MSTFAILGTLSFNTVAKRDTVLSKITTFLSNKPTWGNRVAISSTDMSKQPCINLELRFNSRPDMQALFDLAKTELNKLTGVKATFSKHVCSHSDNPVRPCVIEELATISR